MINTKNISERNIENLLTLTTEYAIYTHYVGEFIINENILSPLRKETRPSFQIFKANDKIRWKDFGTGKSGDFIELVKQMFGLTFTQALNKVYEDLTVIKSKALPYYVFPGIQPKREIKIKKRKFNTNDSNYWAQYGISLEILKDYEVSPLSRYWLTEGLKEMSFGCLANNPVYSYHFGDYKYRLYSPYSRNFKWLTNAGSEILQGWNQLSSQGKKVILTSSLKDVMCLKSFGYEACAPQSENTLVPEKEIIKLIHRFDEVIVFMNNDQAGIEASKRYEERYNFKYVTLPKGPKDPSDYFKMHNRTQTKTILKQLIK